MCSTIALLLVILGPQALRADYYGIARSDEECKAEHGRYDSLYLSGTKEPVFSTGPPEECDTQGCQDGYWGPRSRFIMEPTCPKDLVKGLTGWLREFADQGSPWARDALLLQPCDFWPYIRGRTTWVVGDSVTEMMCWCLIRLLQAIGTSLTTFMIEYWDKEHWEVKLTTDERILAGLHHGIAEGAHGGGKRVPFWCYQMGSLEEWGRLCYLKADKAKRTLHVLNVLPSISSPNDILITNIGIHYNDMDELKDDTTMLAFALENPALPKHKIWMETPPQHYETETGDYSRNYGALGSQVSHRDWLLGSEKATQGKPGAGMYNMTRAIKEQMCFPAGHAQGTNISIFADGSIGVEEGGHRQTESHKDVGLQRLLAGGDRNLASQPTIDARGIPTLRVWNLSLPLYQFHTHVHMPGEEGECSEVPCDCTHVCFPSSTQLSLHHLLKLLKHML